MEQNGAGRCCEARRRPNPGYSFPDNAHAVLQIRQGKPGLGDAPQRQVGVGIDQAGGQAGAQVVAGEPELSLLSRTVRMPAEVVVFRPGDLFFRAFCHGFHSGQTLSRWERGVHQGHEGQPGKRLFRFWRRPASKTGIERPFRSRGNRPGLSEFPGAWNASLLAEMLHCPV